MVFMFGHTRLLTRHFERLKKCKNSPFTVENLSVAGETKPAWGELDSQSDPFLSTGMDRCRASWFLSALSPLLP